MLKTNDEKSSPPLQMLLQYHVLKHGLMIAAPVSLLVALFIFFTYPVEERLFRSGLGLFLGCYFFSLYYFAFGRISSARGMDLLTACFLLVPTCTHAWSITRYPHGEFAGVLMLALLILASMSFVGHRKFLMFVFAILGFETSILFSAGAELRISFWLNTLFVAPCVAFLIRVVVQKNYDLLLERLSYEKQLSAKLASTADALRMSQEEQERSQHDLKQRDLQLSTLLSKAPIVMCVLDRDGQYIQSRGHGLKKLGLVENEIVGEQFTKRYKDHPELVAAFKKAQHGEGSQVRVSLANGLVHEIQYSPVFGDDGELAGVVGVGLDISESALAESQNRELESQLLQAQKMESLGLLASGVAHDFNNYLAAIIAFCDLLDQQPESKSTQSIDRCEIPIEIKKIATSAAGVCEQMLMFAGKSNHEKCDIDLNTLIKEMEQFFRAIVSSEIELDIQLAPHPINIQANPVLVQQSIVNLLKNASEAIKLQPKGERGRIVVSTRIVEGLSPASLTGVRIGQVDPQQESGSFGILGIQDNGGGIDTPDLQQVFNPYHSAKPNGHGFGLAITAGVVKNHNGLIHCDSDSSGTRIDLAFPIVTPKDAPCSHALRASHSASNARRLLLIDDETMITQSIGLVLEGLGYDVTTADSALDGLKQIDSGKEFDCIITDFAMPRINGLEFLAKLRKRQITTPTIMCSGYFELPKNGNILPQATLRKPYSIAKLKETIGEVCTAQPEGLVK